MPNNALGTPRSAEAGAAPSSPDPLLGLQEYATQLEAWLSACPESLRTGAAPIAAYERRVEAMQACMADLFEAGWVRYGWPRELGGLGGGIYHRAIMWEALARHGVPGMALFEHLEILVPSLIAHAQHAFVAEVLPSFLAGRQLWSQGFSEPNAGSDLGSLRSTAHPVDGGYTINGRKIWTSWARYATWCLVLARTGTPESRHRGLTAFAVALRDPGVHVRAIEQANGTDELAEVTFDDVFVPEGRVVGDVGGGWRVAMHILGHERGTFAWFRHCFLHQHLQQGRRLGSPRDDTGLGNALLDLLTVTALGQAALRADDASRELGPAAAFTKLLLGVAEQSLYDWLLAADPELPLVEVDDEEAAVRRQDYLFSRIVTVYGGSQQMQLETIAKHVLHLP